MSEREEEIPAQNKSRLHITHAQNDARYVAMGRRLSLHANPDAGTELRKMNRGKNGRPFRYDDTTIMTSRSSGSCTGCPTTSAKGWPSRS